MTTKTIAKQGKPRYAGLQDLASTVTRYPGAYTRIPGQNPMATAAELAARRKSERLEAATSTTPIRNSTMRGAPFTCPELSTPCSRPGAMDAFRLPSRTGFGTSKAQEH